MWGKVLGEPEQFGSTTVLLLEDEGRAVGFGSCGLQRDEALRNAGFSSEFSAIYILRSDQGRGAGRLIMLAMAKKLSAAGHSAACLWVLRENLRARAFYAKLGGAIVGEKLDERGDATLFEYSYGWRDLSSLGS